MKCDIDTATLSWNACGLDNVMWPRTNDEKRAMRHWQFQVCDVDCMHHACGSSRNTNPWGWYKQDKWRSPKSLLNTKTLVVTDHCISLWRNSELLMSAFKWVYHSYVIRNTISFKAFVGLIFTEGHSVLINPTHKYSDLIQRWDKPGKAEELQIHASNPHSRISDRFHTTLLTTIPLFGLLGTPIIAVAGPYHNVQALPVEDALVVSGPPTPLSIGSWKLIARIKVPVVAERNILKS